MLLGLHSIPIPAQVGDIRFCHPTIREQQAAVFQLVNQNGRAAGLPGPAQQILRLLLPFFPQSAVVEAGQLGSHEIFAL